MNVLDHLSSVPLFPPLRRASRGEASRGEARRGEARRGAFLMKDERNEQTNELGGLAR